MEDDTYLLVRSHGNLISRAEMFSTLWPRVHVEEANLTNIIVQLRKVLGHDAIQTVSKFGYRFTLPVTGEPGVKQAAYASFVRGKELLTERSLDSIRAARDLFWFCIANDPQFAPAWAWLGRTFRLLDKFNGEPSIPDIAEAAFQRAFVIDPDLACAHHFYTHLQVDLGRASEGDGPAGGETDAAWRKIRGRWRGWCRYCAVAACLKIPLPRMNEPSLWIRRSRPASLIPIF